MAGYRPLTETIERVIALLRRVSVARAIIGSSAALLLTIVLRQRLSAHFAIRDIITEPGRVGRRIKRTENEYEPHEYDVVIVGGGTAGCVLASRLSEDPDVRVLLLEAGESSSQMSFAQIPAIYGDAFHSQHDYNLYTVPQNHAFSKVKFWPRGKLLGGCSAINAMIFHHGAPSDFDQWAEYQKGQKGAEGWTYKEFNRYFLKFEKFHPSKTYGPTDLTSRSFTGPVNVGYFSHTAASTKVFLEACSNAGVSPNPDFNTSRGTLGVNKLMTFMDSSRRRVTTESSYLTPSALARPNLKVATKARVARIIFDNTSNGSGLRAVGVQYTNAGELYEVRARKEVIVSAGALHTPHVLMLSGIGPADHLASHNIPVLVDLPGVGSHLMDHPVIDFHYKDKSRALLSGISSGNPRFNPTPYNIFIALALLIQYKLTGRGLLTTNPAESAGFVRSSDPKLFPPNDFPIEEDIEDTTSGPGAPDIEFFHTPVAYMEHGIRMFPKGHYFALHAVLLRPTSKGTVRLISSDPSDEPVLDPEYLSTKHDIDVLVRATRLVTRIARTEPFASLIDPSGDTDPLLDHGLHLASDERIVEFIRDRVETLYHPACSARMAPLEDGGVVDPFLRVHGIPNLRVVDASAFPTITSGHTASPVIAMAEKAADMIKDAIKSK